MAIRARAGRTDVRARELDAAYTTLLKKADATLLRIGVEFARLDDGLDARRRIAPEAMLHANRRLSRRADVLPFGVNRVRLLDAENDFINASFIDVSGLWETLM